MKQLTLMEKYPLFILELPKSETSCIDIDDILHELKKRIEDHPIAVYIATFDHYAHTTGLPEYIIDPNIKAAKNIVFCFGKELPKPEVTGVRPRSIGVCEMEEKFVLSFLEAPNPAANKAMEEWVLSLKK